MTGKRSTGGRAIPRQKIHDALGIPCLNDQFSNPQRGEWRLLCRLHHNRIASGKSGCELPRLHEHREIPWNDLRDHTDRLEARVTEVVAINRNRAALNLTRPTRKVSVAANRRSAERGV